MFHFGFGLNTAEDPLPIYFQVMTSKTEHLVNLHCFVACQSTTPPFSTPTRKTKDSNKQREFLLQNGKCQVSSGFFLAKNIYGGWV